MRRILITVVLVAVPTVGLGVGWLGAVRREEAGHARERRAAVERAADAVVAAASESLEALRVHEDARSYDQYNYYWAPPDVLAAQEAVAVSPLARPPEDVRIVGWFQVDPGGGVRSPSIHDDAPPEVREHGEAVIAALRPEALAACRVLAHGSEEQVQVAQATARVVRRALPANPVQSQGAWTTQVASEIRQAQAGSTSDLDSLVQRGRATRPARSERSWQEVQLENAGRLEMNVMAQSTPGAPLPAGSNPQAQVYVPEPQSVRRSPPPSPPTPATPPRGSTLPQAPSIALGPAAPDAASWSGASPGSAPSQREAPAVQRPARPRRAVVRRAAPPPAPAPAPTGEAVAYTPMAWGLLGDQLALYRVVTSQGTSSVQGLLVDREALLRDWLPELAARQAGAVARVRVVGRGEEAARGQCAVRRALPAPLEASAICLEPLAAGRTASNAMLLQVATLIGLVLLLGAGSASLVVGERRAARFAVMQREFVANVSHELRTPLTTLRMHAELLREGWVDEASRARFYDDLVVESTRLGQLVENVLTLSRLERGNGPKAEPGDLGATVREAVEKRRRFLELRGFAVTVEVEDARARFDREAVDAIVANLLDNAVKYGGGSERSVHVAVNATGPWVLLTVADRGPGIAAPERERVFEAFYRTEESRRGTTGTGLGLALVLRLARDQGGDAEVLASDRGCAVQVRFRAVPREAT